MVTVSFDFSQIPAQWVAEETPAGSKVVKTLPEGRKGGGEGGGDTESLSLSLFLEEGSPREISPRTGRKSVLLFDEPAFLFAVFSPFQEGRGGGLYFLELGLREIRREGRKEGRMDK